MIAVQNSLATIQNINGHSPSDASQKLLTRSVHHRISKHLFFFFSSFLTGQLPDSMWHLRLCSQLIWSSTRTTLERSSSFSFSNDWTWLEMANLIPKCFLSFKLIYKKMSLSFQTLPSSEVVETLKCFESRSIRINITSTQFNNAPKRNTKKKERTLSKNLKIIFQKKMEVIQKKK